jgi:sulfopyruvate decarboxylase alpha subunit
MTMESSGHHADTPPSGRGGRPSPVPEGRPSPVDGERATPGLEDWSDSVHQVLAGEGVRLVSYVPDAGHRRLIERCQDDHALTAVPLTTEEEGIGLAMGAWLGGVKSVLLLQSSGVGNLVNVLGALGECRFPLVMLVTMRGEHGEFNPWQVPMGRATPGVLREMGVTVDRVTDARMVATRVEAALRQAYGSYAVVAVLISQSLIGMKSFQEGAAG